MELLLERLKTCDHKSAVRLLLSELCEKGNKREMARWLHPDKHLGDPFFESAMKALNCAVELLEGNYAENVRKNKENRRNAERAHAMNNAP